MKTRPFNYEAYKKGDKCQTVCGLKVLKIIELGTGKEYDLCAVIENGNLRSPDLLPINYNGLCASLTRANDIVMCEKKIKLSIGINLNSDTGVYETTKAYESKAIESDKPGNWIIKEIEVEI